MTNAQSILGNLGINSSTVNALPTEESEKLEQMEIRRANCGQWSVRIDATTGGWKKHLHTCGQWRDHFCERCFQRRKEEVYGILMQIDEDCDSPVAIRVTPDEAKVLTRRMRDAGVNYRRFPTENGDVVIFDMSEFEWYGETIQPGELDAGELANTPLRKRMSGRLGEKPPVVGGDGDKDDPGEVITIKVESIVATAGQGHTLSEAWKVAMEKTRNLDPEFDADLLQWACWVRMSAYREAIVEMGGTINYVCTMNESVSSNSYTGWVYNEEDDEELGEMDLLWLHGRV